jgi:2,5-diamino-6-(ribosylamino)-4(3H)-pyrimidinone 5'-phosphate reductase
MKRPYIVINCAISSDGKMASSSGKQVRISCEEDIKRMYKLRNCSDAVLVGINTVLSDDPKLTVKEKYIKNPKQPMRVVLDTDCRTPINSLVVNNTSKTLIATEKGCEKGFSDNVEIAICNITDDGLIDLENLFEILSKKGVKKLMVEGGGTVIFNFLKKEFVDDFYIYIGSMKIKGGKIPPFIVKNKIDIKNLNLELIKKKRLGFGHLCHYRLIK